MKRTEIQVYGRVQGVFFREETRQMAVSLGLVGWVKNEPDGSVKIVAEGPEEKLRELEEWCRKGPRSAKIRDIQVEWKEAKGKFEEFEIQE